MSCEWLHAQGQHISVGPLINVQRVEWMMVGAKSVILVQLATI